MNPDIIRETLTKASVEFKKRRAKKYLQTYHALQNQKKLLLSDGPKNGKWVVEATTKLLEILKAKGIDLTEVKAGEGTWWNKEQVDLKGTYKGLGIDGHIQVKYPTNKKLTLWLEMWFSSKDTAPTGVWRGSSALAISHGDRTIIYDRLLINMVKPHGR